MQFIVYAMLCCTLSVQAQIEKDLVLELKTGTQVEIDNINTPSKGMIVFNTTDNKVYDYNGTHWTTPDTFVSTDTDNQISSGTDNGIYLGPTVYAGYFIIDASGNKTITGIPFEPSQITFAAHANIETLDLNSDNGVGDNDGTLNNSFGTMNGFGRSDSGTIVQQVIYVGGSGNSINDISRYASSSNCIGIRYGNQNGNQVGRINGSLLSFTTDGFVLNIERTTSAANENLVVLYTAYK
ncbi:MAG: FIG00552510: hypothetical protein [uncultured Sulfurovum sp.]|uniref:Uncharacterized protein n=1 Tax=uncultured Sulfurovum sp. TaxID=269237 RepID=A0A6S6S5M5_9BACT|nr:MAG: FIG00552510: hypothetical protein [uncultured Sulfurovum sp.]